MAWDWSYAWSILPELLEGLKFTVAVTLVGSSIGMILGLVIGFIQFNGPRILSYPLAGYVYFVRGTPFLVQLYFIFFVLPEFGVLLSPVVSGMIGLGVMSSPYYSETFRAGLQSVDRGQWDAATALNLSTWRTWRTVALPQALRPIAPALGNYVNSMFKVSALLFAISVPELFGVATTVGNSVFRYLEPMTMAAALYLIVSVPVGLFIGHFERRSDRVRS